MSTLNKQLNLKIIVEKFDKLKVVINKTMYIDRYIHTYNIIYYKVN